MKKRTKKAVLSLVVILFLGAFPLSSCAKKPPDYFAYTQKNASCEIAGTLHGSPFGARIVLSPVGEGCCAEIEYLQHPAWQGLSIQARFDASGRAVGTAEVRAYELSRTQTAASLSGLLAPLSALLEIREARAVQFDKSAYTLTFADGALTVTQDGIPCKVSSETVDFWIVWWEKGEKSIQ